jgi:hypothetical protein
LFPGQPATSDFLRTLVQQYRNPGKSFTELALSVLLPEKLDQILEQSLKIKVDGEELQISAQVCHGCLLYARVVIETLHPMRWGLPAPSNDHEVREEHARDSFDL